MKKTSKIAILISFLSFFGMAQKVMASCTVSVSPNNVVMGVSSVSRFSVSNTSDQLANWVRIESPDLTAYSIAQINSDGWYGSGGGTRADFAGGYLEGGASGNFDLMLAETGETIPSMGFEVLLSYDAGDTFESCGTATIQVVPAPVAPTIGGVNLTVGNSSATLTWSTNLTATGKVNYGTTSGYGSSVVTASGTTHSAGMTGLSASTEYHYQIQVTSEGGTTSTADATFTTSAADVITTTLTTVTNTVTSTVTTTNNQTINKTVVLADTVKPAVKVDTIVNPSSRKPVNPAMQNVFDIPPIVEGKVVDTGAVNVGIVKIQYSTDNGKSWLLIEEPNGASKIDFSFVPEVYDDGNYPILVRAIDKSGNVGVSTVFTLIIDRLPPRIIHSLWRVGPIVLSAPYQLIPGVPVQVSVQAVGGVTEMKLELRNQEVGASDKSEQVFSLIKNFETGLWEGEINISYSSIPVIVRAKDGGGNEIEQEIGEINISEIGLPAQAGKAVSQQASISVYRYDELTKRFKLWNGEVYGQDNPSKGKSSWYLPPGKYYVEAKVKGYKTAQTEIFELDMPGAVRVEGELEKWAWNNWWKYGTLGILHSRSEGGSHSGSVIPGKQISWLEKTEWRGKEIDLTVLPLWEPRLAEILGGLKEESVVVIPGANQSSVELLKNRGSYKSTMIADPDGEILSDLQGASLPVSLMINRRGQVETPTQ